MLTPHHIYSRPLTGPRPQVLQLIDICYALYSWVIDWGWHEVKGEPQQVHYLILCMEELVAMGVDLEELLSILISDTIGNPWCKGTKTFEYLTIKGKIQEAEPGDYVDGMRVWRVTLQPRPDAFPFVVFVRAFESACKNVGCESHDYYFTYHDIVFDHPSKLARSITNHECDPLCLSQEIIYWRATACAELATRFGSHWRDQEDDVQDLREISDKELRAYLREHLRALDRGEKRVQGVLLQRYDVAVILGYTTEAVRGWDKRGSAPGGVTWPCVTKNGREAIYPLADFLEAMQKVQRGEFIPVSADEMYEDSLVLA